jgi:hypothetical protein
MCKRSFVTPALVLTILLAFGLAWAADIPVEPYVEVTFATAGVEAFPLPRPLIRKGSRSTGR